MPTLCSKKLCINLTSSQDLERNTQPYKLCGPCRARGRELRDNGDEEDIDTKSGVISNDDQDDLKRELDSKLDGDDKADLDLDVKPLTGIVASTGARSPDRVVRERARNIRRDFSDAAASDVDSEGEIAALERLVETAFEMNKIEARLRVLRARARARASQTPANQRQRVPSGAISGGKRLRQAGDLESRTNRKKGQKIM
ncbi:hypothetical protein BJ138DRAFT_1197923 [Hygrophoropsis aurantiaca]|uniref:Uncharacterized protein n=1 Tax=Hygrophoropsis aurantiaca TaxID=72124 RepID=A0ACB7ZPG4_9AGAM|nr:hypothetical protein BJ138DRAFT_1197923 [Hygrophoropsis aurantiaca]